jgi:MFS family permease
MPDVSPDSRQKTTLWQDREFLKLWAGQAVSELGSTITREAMLLLALLVLGATPLEMGVLSALGGLPVLVFGVAAGVWVDRLRRRPLMIATDLSRAVLLALIPLAAFLGVLRIEMLYGIVVLTGLLGIFFSTAYRAYLPGLVERAHLVEGNSKLAMSESAAEIGGSGLAGVLVQVIGAPFAILLDALTFLVSAGSLAFIRRPEPPPAQVAETASFGREALEGLRATATQPILRTLAVAAAIQSFLGNIFAPLYSLYAIRELGLGPAAVGLTIALGGVSSLTGALLAERILRRFGLGRTLIATMGLSSLTALLIPLAAFFSPHAASGAFFSVGLLFLGTAQLLGDALDTVYAIHTISLRQAITPDRLLGRVNASLELVQEGIAPLGALTGGILGGVLGVQAALFIASLAGILSALWITASPIRVLQKIPE